MRRSRWAALAVLLAGAVVLLLALREQEPPRSRAGATFPRMRDEEVARMHRRATLALPSVSEPATAAPKRDPLLVALPIKPDSPVVVFEINALRYSPLGERFLACVRAQDQNRFADIVRKTGIDPLKDIDRVAFVGDSTVVSGQFDHAHWNELGSPGEPYGQAGRIYVTSSGAVGAWRDQIAVFASGPDDVRTAIDQLEGRSAVPDTGFPEELTYGEIYGLVPGAAARRILGGEGGEGGEGGLLNRVASLASRVELHVDAMQDLNAEVRVRGEDAAGLSDLADGLGAALTAARVKSKLTGNKHLSTLLEKAKVRPGEREFSLQLSVPAARVGELFGDDCKIFGPPTARAGDDRAPKLQTEAVGGPT